VSQKEVDDVLAHAYSSLLKEFHEPGKKEITGLGTFVLAHSKVRKMQKDLEAYKNAFERDGKPLWVEDTEQKMALLKKIIGDEEIYSHIKENRSRNLEQYVVRDTESKEESSHSQ
jgi:hypothetical protein